MLLEEFLKYTQRESLFTKANKVLVGVSGGVDSIVLCELLHQANIEFAIAHCNFGLRGAESDGDDIFVASLAEKYEVEHFKKFFDTKAYAEEAGVSIQMAARDLRYNWFEEIIEKHNYDYVAVGTHLNDDIETLFINLVRGTGLKGLSGIQPKVNRVIRPLLFATRDRIVAFAKEFQLSWREDSSNADTKYLRNKIRHEIVPVLKSINENIEEVLTENMMRFKQVDLFLEDYMDKVRSKVVAIDNDLIKLNIALLLKESQPNLILYHLLKDYGVKASQTDDILKALDGIPGKQFYTQDYKLVIDREEILITRSVKKSQNEVFEIAFLDKEIAHPFSWEIETKEVESFRLITDKNTACLDFDKLQFPLKLRKWKEGDWFKPLGMSGKKKVSDFLIDTKVSRVQKQETWVLTSEEKIVWIVGHRIDDRFKLDNHSKKVYLIAPFSKA